MSPPFMHSIIETFEIRRISVKHFTG
jgi:hypothetical protein